MEGILSLDLLLDLLDDLSYGILVGALRETNTRKLDNTDETKEEVDGSEARMFVSVVFCFGAIFWTGRGRTGSSWA